MPTDRLARCAPQVSYLLAACLTDQKVLLVSADPTVLLPAAEALRSLIAPLRYSSLYIPCMLRSGSNPQLTARR